MPSALTKDQIKIEERAKAALKAIPHAQRSLIIAHLANLQSEQLERLIEATEPVRIHRAQGQVSAIQTVIDLMVVT